MVRELEDRCMLALTVDQEAAASYYSRSAKGGVETAQVITQANPGREYQPLWYASGTDSMADRRETISAGYTLISSHGDRRIRPSV